MAGYPRRRRAGRTEPLATLTRPHPSACRTLHATPLPQLTEEVAMLAARVDEHLQKMGVVWK